MLYIYVIQKRASPPETYSSYFEAAARCQSRISGMAEKGSLSERYCLVLEELRIEALRQSKRLNQTMATLDGTEYSTHGDFSMATSSLPMDSTIDIANNYEELLGDAAAMGFNNVPGSTVSDSSDWGHFASMVSSGLGNLDLFLEDNGLGF